MNEMNAIGQPLDTTPPCEQTDRQTGKLFNIWKELVASQSFRKNKNAKKDVDYLGQEVIQFESFQYALQ